MRFTLIIICLVTIVFYGFVANLYFAQDDFFHTKVSQTDGSLKEFMNLFSFRSFDERGGIYFYRPIFREGLFNVFYRNFGLNPVPYRLAQLLIHLINIVLVYKTIFLVTKKITISLVASLVFGISAANVGVLTYLAGGIQASGMTMFLLISLINYSKSKMLAFLFFLLALASHELATTFPAILVGLAWLRRQLNRKFLISLIPYSVVIVLYLILQVKMIGLPVGEQEYKLSFSISRTLNSFVWYFVWSLGIPEMLLDFVGPGIKLNPNLMMYWGGYFKVIFLFFGIILIGFLMKLKSLIKHKILWFFVFWFFVGISPVVFLPFHRSTYYLAPVLPAVGGIIGLLFSMLYKQKKILGYLFICVLLALSFTTINLSKTTFWAITRSKIAKNLINDVKTVYPDLPQGASIYFTNDPDYPVISKEWGGSSKQARVVLSGNDALQIVYKDSTIRVYYEDDILKPQEPFFPIRAKIMAWSEK